MAAFLRQADMLGLNVCFWAESGRKSVPLKESANSQLQT